MDPEAWQHAKDLFSQALEREPSQRPAFLSQACGGDERLRQEVEYLLAAHQDADMLAMEIAVARLAAIPEDANVGRRIGAYQVVKRIGQGGMASVYLAFRADDQYRKQVAIKFVRSEAANPNLLQRFRNERQTLAALEHPNVVRFLDGGATAEGQPYLVMEFVEGTAITDSADSHRLSIDERLKLFRAVCEAVSTSDDGRLTAIVNGTGIEVRSDSSGKPEAAFYFANEAVTVAIQEQPRMVMTEVNGKLMAWPLAEK